MTYRDVKAQLRRGAIANAGHALSQQLRESATTNPKAWAWKLRERHLAGEKLSPARIRDYQEALHFELLKLEADERAQGGAP